MSIFRRTRKIATGVTEGSGEKICINEPEELKILENILE